MQVHQFMRCFLFFVVVVVLAVVIVVGFFIFASLYTIKSTQGSFRRGYEARKSIFLLLKQFVIVCVCAVLCALMLEGISLP